MKFQQIVRKYIINNIGYKILAVVFSFLLWLVILNITDPEYTRTLTNIPVQIKNENLVLDGTHVYTVASGDITNVIVTGKRSIISTLLPTDFIVTADFGELSITNAVPIRVELRSNKARYASQISMSTKDTNMIINLEEMTSSQIPVTLEYVGTGPDNIVIDEANLYPKKVTIEAPQSITESAAAAVVYADLSQITSDTEMYLTPDLRDANGEPVKINDNTSLDVDQILAEFRTSVKKNVPIKVNMLGIPAPGYAVTGIELSQDTIAVKGPANVIAELESVELPAELIDVTGATEDVYVEVDITPYLPDEVVVFGESPTLMLWAKVVDEKTLKEQMETVSAQEGEGAGEEIGADEAEMAEDGPIEAAPIEEAPLGEPPAEGGPAGAPPAEGGAAGETGG